MSTAFSLQLAQLQSINQQVPAKVSRRVPAHIPARLQQSPLVHNQQSARPAPRSHGLVLAGLPQDVNPVSPGNTATSSDTDTIAAIVTGEAHYWFICNLSPPICKNVGLSVCNCIVTCTALDPRVSH